MRGTAKMSEAKVVTIELWCPAQRRVVKLFVNEIIKGRIAELIVPSYCEIALTCPLNRQKGCLLDKEIEGRFP